MPIFTSVEWFDEVRHLINSDESVSTAGGGMCDATVGIKCDDQVYILVFEGFECSSANQVSEDDLVNADFYIEMTSSEWSLMLIDIKENGRAGMDYSLNTLDMDRENGLALSKNGDQYRLDMFFRFMQTFQNFFDLSSKIETQFNQ